MILGDSKLDLLVAANYQGANIGPGSKSNVLTTMNCMDKKLHMG